MQQGIPQILVLAAHHDDPAPAREAVVMPAPELPQSPNMKIVEFTADCLRRTPADAGW
jgi:hypothetical protein